MVLAKALRRCIRTRNLHLRNVCHNQNVAGRGRGSEALRETNDNLEAAFYVHWPYCARRCTYCNFNKYINKNVNHERMTACLAREAETLIKLSGVKKISSVFFGGGTPSLALPSSIERVLDTIRQHATLAEGSEVTLEANPTHLEAQRLQDFHTAGVNRLSLGIQALNDEDLKVLGRDHSLTEALRCLETARGIYPGRVSVDLIFGRPGQTLKQWTDELLQMLSLCDDHVSLYQLTLERGTQLFKWAESGQINCPDNDTMADMYTTAVQTLASHGFTRYEVSNFARNGSVSNHNKAYWTGQNYIGVGPGAHGRFVPMNKQGKVVPAREARIQTLEPDNWMYEVEKFGHATRKIVQQTDYDRLVELLSLGLRMPTGISNKRWKHFSDYGSLQDMFEGSQRVNMLIEEQLLELDEKGLRATNQGLIVLDSIIPHLLLELDNKHTASSVILS